MTSALVSSETKIKKSGRELSPEQAAAVAMVEAAKYGSRTLGSWLVRVGPVDHKGSCLAMIMV